MASFVAGSIPALIRNDDGRYEGDLRYWVRTIVKNGTNLNNPYHNFRHMLHVPWLCWDALYFYGPEHISARSGRNLLVAGLLHDINHSGKAGSDADNIARAVAFLEQHAPEEDAPYLSAIAGYIKGTQFPYAVAAGELDLCGLILRDADLSQAFSVAWIQQVVFGLAAEWGKDPIDVLKMQKPFLSSIKFNTAWARDRFPPEAVASKIAEAEELCDILA